MDLCKYKRFDRVPQIAVPQKVIICVDVVQDLTMEPFEKPGQDIDPNLLLKKSLSIFVHNKHSVNNLHEFAVLTFQQDKVKWIQDFCKDPKTVSEAIDHLEFVTCENSKDVDLTCVFKEIKNRVTLPDVKFPVIQIPEYIVHVILIYNSSYNVPNIHHMDENVNYLFSSDYFFYDVMYLHDSSFDNDCPTIYNNLQLSVAHSVRLGSTKKNGYIFECPRNLVRLLNRLSDLLAHPLLRMEQTFKD